MACTAMARWIDEFLWPATQAVKEAELAARCGYHAGLLSLGALRDARRDTPVPIARGFATGGTDSGHQNAKLPEPRAFALNEESLVEH